MKLTSAHQRTPPREEMNMIAERRHTPGPWRVGRGGPNQCPTIGTEGGLMVAMVSHGNEHPTQANASLIAAAPCLLEALKGYMAAVATMNAAMQDGGNVHGALSAIIGWEDIAKFAIKKAEGQA